MTYRFLGTEAEIAGKKLISLGQAVDLEPTEADAMILGAGSAAGFAGGIALLPDEQFADLGFTEQELLKYEYPGMRAIAPPEFAAKYKAALIALHDFRVSLEGK